jgi:hypothetical protein
MGKSARRINVIVDSVLSAKHSLIFDSIYKMDPSGAVVDSYSRYTSANNMYPSMGVLDPPWKKETT